MTLTWTPPINWTADKAITTTRLNQFLGDDGANPGDLSYLFARPLFFGKRTTNATTTSTTFVDLDTTNLQGTVTPAGTQLLIVFTAFCSAFRDAAKFDILIDGTSVSSSVGVAGYSPATGGSFDGTAAIAYVATVTAGASHTIKIQWKDANVATNAEVDYATLTVLEIG